MIFRLIHWDKMNTPKNLFSKDGFFCPLGYELVLLSCQYVRFFPCMLDKNQYWFKTHFLLLESAASPTGSLMSAKSAFRNWNVSRKHQPWCGSAQPTLAGLDKELQFRNWTKSKVIHGWRLCHLRSKDLLTSFLQFSRFLFPQLPTDLETSLKGGKNGS